MTVQFIKEASTVLEIRELYLTPEGRILGTTSDKSIVVEHKSSKSHRFSSEGIEIEVLLGEEDFIKIFATRNGNGTSDTKAEIKLKPTCFNMIQRVLIRGMEVGENSPTSPPLPILHVEVDCLSQLGEMRYGYISGLSIAT